MNGESLRVLSLQAWYGGSHRQFADGWSRHSTHQWTSIGLPAQNWKWRMRYAAIELATRVRRRADRGESWEAIVCTDMLNVAEFRALAGRCQNVPIVLYFHENQFAYPARGKHQPDHHFLFTNLVSALAADEVWFNSAFNLRSMLEGIKERAQAWPEFSAEDSIRAIESKSKIVAPPIESAPERLALAMRQRKERVAAGEDLHLVWAARWEYDKNPEALLECLKLLQQQRVPFRLSVIGEQAETIPKAFDTIRAQFDLQIENWGYQESREGYWSVLQSADVFLSTAQHEFFGLSAAEAIATGCWPLLPNRLAYPEVIDVDGNQVRSELFLYQSSAKDLAKAIRQLHHDRAWNFAALEELAQELSTRLDFPTRAAAMDDLLSDLISRLKRI